MDDYNAMGEQLELHMRHLRELEKKAAVYGIDVPPHIALGINDLQKRIDEIQHNRSDLDGSRIYTPGNIDCVTHIWTYADRSDSAEDTNQAELFRPVDLFSYYEDDQLPSAEQWNHEILPRLQEAARPMRQHKAIKAYVDATPAVGIAFGSLFAGAPKPIWVYQRGKAISSAFWNSNAPAARLHRPVPTVIDRSDGEDSVIEVCPIASQAKRVSGEVSRTVSDLQIAYKRRISIGHDLPSGVLGPGHAVAIAHVVGSSVRDALGNGGRVHLFAAVPIALAVFIGAELNTCSKIQLYEHVKKDTGGTPYVPACLL